MVLALEHDVDLSHDCAVNEYTVWGWGQDSVSGQSMCDVWWRGSNWGRFFFDYFSLLVQYHFTIFPTQISLIFHQFSMILALTVFSNKASSIPLYIQCHSFGTRPQKMRISQRQFIRF